MGDAATTLIEHTCSSDHLVEIHYTRIIVVTIYSDCVV